MAHNPRLQSLRSRMSRQQYHDISGCITSPFKSREQRINRYILVLCLLSFFYLVRSSAFEMVPPTYRLGFPSNMPKGQPTIDSFSLRLPFPSNSCLYQADIKTNLHSPLSLQKELPSPPSLYTIGRHPFSFHGTYLLPFHPWLTVIHSLAYNFTEPNPSTHI